MNGIFTRMAESIISRTSPELRTVQPLILLSETPWTPNCEADTLGLKPRDSEKGPRETPKSMIPRVRRFEVENSGAFRALALSAIQSVVHTVSG